MKDETVVCRCEDITLEEVRHLIKHGFTTMDEIKRISRLGMGPCQGRTCRSLVMAEIARLTGKDIEDLKIATFRPPTKPIKLGVLAGGAGHD
ncbi:MAG: (2Fe-2S)-binding protein [Syntrophomonadaceae bacterium]|jgi:bacterioferritin-associated ferredoxin|nr:(2Fe-2S)-binding protein [Syntrophomonadaceae bacterium]